MRKKQQATVPASVEKFTIPIFGDELDVAIHDHTLYVSVKRVCEHLGLNYTSQYTKLKVASWATVPMIGMVDPNGRLRDTVMIRVNDIPMWMTTIQVARVKLEVRPKLRWYHEQARDVLAKAFLPTFEEAAHEVCDDLGELKDGMKVVVALAPLVHAHEAQITALQAEVIVLREEMTYLRAAAKDTLLALKEAQEEAVFGDVKRPFKRPFTFSTAMEWLFGR